MGDGPSVSSRSACGYRFSSLDILIKNVDANLQIRFAKSFEIDLDLKERLLRRCFMQRYAEIPCLRDCIRFIIICERRKYLKSSAFVPDQLLRVSSRKEAHKKILYSKFMSGMTGTRDIKVAVVGSEKTGCESSETVALRHSGLSIHIITIGRVRS